VLAAGKGTRMKSDRPKVLFEVCARPMIEYVLDALAEAGVDRTLVVVGFRSDLVREQLANRPNITFVEQTEQKGTGHAVMVCREHLADYDGPVLVVTGDSPMIRAQSLGKLFAEFDQSQAACVLGSAHKDNPTGLGRIVRDAQGAFQAIVEEKDASQAQRAITEVNMSCYVFNNRDLLAALEQLRPNNVQGEYYVTDCPGILLRGGRDVRALDVLHPSESLSINSLDELATVEAAMKNMRRP
jgi:bifunctional UDP-N-acetylglucosamine pyrophosphorylase/glucosamine-1-phosphate N-acetyltransferase/UDP-N-acetylglucosamine pyrophosphorylase